MAYDYIIIGAGSAGCVLANRLSADPTRRILLLEAGGRDDHPYIQMPLGFLQALRNPDLAWQYLSEPEPHLGGRRVPLPRGRVLGGSSSINGMIHFRGHPLDFDEWADLGCTGWSYRDVLPYFRRSESHWAGASELRGGDGPIRVKRVGARESLMTEELAEAVHALGFDRIDDWDGVRNDGLAPALVAIHQGRRCSSARAYLDPVKARPNLDIRTGAWTQRILFEGRRATGVEYDADSRRRTATLRPGGEVILSSGTYNSPQLLMLSGIGPAAALAAMGIDVVHDLPGVGENLQEHVRIPHQIEATLAKSFVQELRFDRAAFSFLRWAAAGQGAFADQIVTGCLLARTRPDLPRPDLQLMVSPTRIDANIWFPGVRARPGDCFYDSICLLRPESRGRVSLGSADPRTPPRILFNMLEAEKDRQVLIEGLKLSRRLFATAPLAGLVGEEVLPGAHVASDAEIAAALPELAGVVHHPVGTCAMGVGPGAVVDPSLRVRGVEGLRVADASVMPRLVGANTNAATVMIGEKASDLILSAA